MSVLTRQRCFTHPLREAAARCPSCERFFCRECVTEHAGRLICASCLRARIAAETRASAARWRPWRVFAAAGRTLQLAGCVLLAWFFFHLLGQMLLSLPDQFHEDTLWKAFEQTGDDS